jgi:hypothetical protein
MLFALLAGSSIQFNASISAVLVTTFRVREVLHIYLFVFSLTTRTVQLGVAEPLVNKKSK